VVAILNNFIVIKNQKLYILVVHSKESIEKQMRGIDLKKEVVIIVLFWVIINSIIAAGVEVNTSAGSNITSFNITVAPDQRSTSGFCYSARGLIYNAGTRIKGIVVWALTRDYGSAARNLTKRILGLSIGIKLLLLFIVIVLLIILWNYFLRDSKANNIRRARNHHRMGEEAHRRGEEDAANDHYELSKYYREKALEEE
jgi:hypothetical protein